jgi:hypothetical protein
MKKIGMIALLLATQSQASSLYPQTLQPVSHEQARQLDSAFLGRASDLAIRVQLEPAIETGSPNQHSEIRGTLIGANRSLPFMQTFSQRTEGSDPELVEITQLIATEERGGACGHLREERLRLKARILENREVVAIEATLDVGTTEDRCHFDMDHQDAVFKADPRLLCEKLMTVYQGRGTVPVFTLGRDGSELRGFAGNQAERSHPQSSIPVPASLIAEAGSQRIYFVPHLGSPLPREGKLLSCDVETGAVNTLANRVELSCNDIPAPMRLRATWMDCR